MCSQVDSAVFQVMAYIHFKLSLNAYWSNWRDWHSSCFNLLFIYFYFFSVKGGIIVLEHVTLKHHFAMGSCSHLDLRVLPCTGGSGRHERGALADRCVFSSAVLTLFGLAQFICAGVSEGLRQIWAPKAAVPARREQMSVLLPYTESDRPVKSVKVGVWQWLTIPNSAEEFCIDNAAFPCGVWHALLTLPARIKK